MALTPTPTAVPIATPTAVPTAPPTAAITATPTAMPTAVPTATPTAVPTATPTAAPTATPTAVPTATPTALPTATPTPRPTSTPRPTATPPPTSTPRPTATPIPPYAAVWESLSNAGWLERNRPALASAITAFPWVADGIDEAEQEAVQELVHLATFYEMTFGVLMDKPWVADGLDDFERKVVQRLGWIADEEESAAVEIARMPFLDVLEPADDAAVESLWLLAYLKQPDFKRVMAHPTMSGGITDHWAKIVAVLYGVSTTNPQLIGTLLDPDRVTMEERAIDLPLAGRVDLAIIRTGPGAPRSMDLLEHAVRHAEDFLAVPFPTGYVGWLFGDAVTPSFAGNYFGTHIASLPQYDANDGNHDAESTGTHIAHEVAHYYWSGSSSWVDEGAANFMTSVAEKTRTGRPVTVNNAPCGYVRTIAELERLAPSHEDDAFICNYAFGERLFVDLYRNLNEERFRRGFQELYRLSEAEDDDETEAGTEVGMSHLRIAFELGADIAASVVDVVTARWYEGTERYDTSARDTRPVDPALRAVSGRITRAYVSTIEDGTPGSSFSARAANDWVWLFLHYAHAVSEPREVELELVDYFEDGFVFNRRSVSFTAEPGYSGGSWRLAVGPPPSERWAVGRYWVYVYHEGRKVAEVEYEVTA